MKLSDLNPHIRHAQLHTSPFFERAEPSICCDCRVFFMDNIEGEFHVGGKTYNIINKTSIFLPPETEYKMDVVFKSNASFIVFNFDLTNIHEHIDTSIGTPLKSKFEKSMVLPYELPEELSKPIIRQIPHIKRTLVQCVNSHILKSAFYRENSSAMLKQCLLEFLKDDSGLTRSELCKNVLSFIHENYADSNLTNEEVAAHFSYHPYHLSHIVKAETGKTLHQFIIYYRLRMAQDLLLTVDSDIAEVAWKCGFASAAYFTKLFKQNIGMTPKEYRRRYTDAGF